MATLATTAKILMQINQHLVPITKSEKHSKGIGQIKLCVR